MYSPLIQKKKQILFVIFLKLSRLIATNACQEQQERKASRIDSTSSKVIKGCSAALAFHLANIISLLIKLDTFPSKWKIAKTKPLFKKGI